MQAIFICGRCGYRSHHKWLCHNCKIHLEPECENCHNAIGNCVCLYHGSPSHKIKKIKMDLRRRIVGVKSSSKRKGKNRIKEK